MIADKRMDALVPRELANVGRFGGISPVVIRELSGVYQPFFKACKELVSNSYDADASRVLLIFSSGFRDLRIEDNGVGMNPIQFVRDYIRIGRGHNPPVKTPGGRWRIGGKGIGFLAPARYCRVMVVETKVRQQYQGARQVPLTGLFLPLEEVVPELPLSSELMRFLTIDECLVNGRPIPFRLTSTLLELDDMPLGESVEVRYTLQAQYLSLRATIDFERLFRLDSAESMEKLTNFCEFTLRVAEPNEVDESYCHIDLQGLHDFVVTELSAPAKRGRNKESASGYERFWWNLGRVIPVEADPRISEMLPPEVVEVIRESDRFTLDKVEVHGGPDGATVLHRPVFIPTFPFTEEHRDLFHVINQETSVNGRRVRVVGYLLGNPVTLFPAELRGIQVRVNHVAIGEPILFGLEHILTGAARVGAGQVTGELNILEGVDAVEDLNPGREGFYAESPVYRLLREWVVGGENRIDGPLKRIADAIVARSELGASADHFMKRMKGIRQALVDAVALIGELRMTHGDVADGFFEATPHAMELLMSGDTQFRPEGRLSTFMLVTNQDMSKEYQIDFHNRRFYVNAKLDMWRRNVAIGEDQFDVVFKSAKNVSLFTAVVPSQRRILINWEHPLRGALGDTAFIKHCFATIASRLPQEGLEIYLRLVSHRPG